MRTYQTQILLENMSLKDTSFSDEQTKTLMELDEIDRKLFYSRTKMTFIHNFGT